jgi:hypothetical protein
MCSTGGEDCCLIVWRVKGGEHRGDDDDGSDGGTPIARDSYPATAAATAPSSSRAFGTVESVMSLPPPPPPPPSAAGSWVLVVDAATGRPYEFNTLTRETRWASVPPPPPQY